MEHFKISCKDIWTVSRNLIDNRKVNKMVPITNLKGSCIPNSWVETFNTSNDLQGRKLDYYLGTGFSLIGINPIESLGVEQNFKVLKRSKFNTLPLSIVILCNVNDRWIKFLDETNHEIKVEYCKLCDHRFDNFKKDIENKWILVRPDRTVSFICTMDDLETEWNKWFN